MKWSMLILPASLIMWAAIIYGFTCVMAKADEIENLAIYGVDRAHCHINIPQALIDRNIVEGSIKYNATAKQVLTRAGEIGTTIIAILKENNDRGEYCARRMGN